MAKHVIYKIYWPYKGFYFGKTKGFRKRRNRHLREMSDGTHHNKHLVMMFAKYGAPKIIIIARAKCDRSLAALEIKYLEGSKGHKKCCNIKHK